jgi:hypothetical protein
MGEDQGGNPWVDLGAWRRGSTEGVVRSWCVAAAAGWSASKPRRPEVAGCDQAEEAAIRAATDERKEEDVIKKIWNHGAHNALEKHV